jgi:hypothetical protein
MKESLYNRSWLFQVPLCPALLCADCLSGASLCTGNLASRAQSLRVFMGGDSGFRQWEEDRFGQSEGRCARLICISQATF